MNRAHRLVARRTFTTIFLSFLSVLLFSLGLSTVILYSNFEEVTVEELHKNTLEMLEQARHVFESVHVNSIPAYIQFSYEPTIARLMYGSELDDYFVARGIKRLDDALVSNPLVHSIYVYNHLQQKLYSTVRGIESPESCSDPRIMGMLRDITPYGVYRYIPRRLDLGSRGVQNVFTLIVGTPPFDGVALKGALIINISERRLRQVILDQERDHAAELIILDRSGTILSHPEAPLFGRKSADDPRLSLVSRMEGTRGASVVNEQGTRQLVSHVSAPRMGWTFATITPYDRIFSKVARLRNRILTTSGLLFVVCAGISFLLSRRIYAPIRRIVRSVQTALGRPEETAIAPADSTRRPRTDLQYLEIALNQTFARIRELARFVDNHRDLHRHELFRSLLTGTIAPEQVSLEQVSMAEDAATPPADRFLLAVLSIDRYLSLQDALGPDRLRELRRIVSELAAGGRGGPLHVLDMNKDHVCCLYRSADGEAVAATLQGLQQVIEKSLPCTVTVGFNAEEVDYDELIEAYEHAVRLTREKFRHGHGAFVTAATTVDRNGSAPFTEEDLRSLEKNLRVGAIREAEEGLAELFRKVSAVGTPEDFSLLVQLLVYHLRNLYGSTPMLAHSLPLELERIHESVGWVETADDAVEAFRRICRDYSQRIQAHHANRRQETLEEVHKIVSEHLGDPGLCAAMVAEEVGLSVNYLRNLFKQIEGISLPDHIMTVRIERAKELLRESTRTIKTIARETGFTNYTYFFTAFKKATGLTPGLYRQQRADPSAAVSADSRSA